MDSKKRKVIFPIAMVLLALVWVVAMARLFTPQPETFIPQNTATAFDRTTPLPAVIATPGGLTQDDPAVPYALQESASGLMQSILYSGSMLVTQAAAERLVIGERNPNPDYIEILPGSKVQVNFGLATWVSVYRGGVYVQPGAGWLEVRLPGALGAVARARGGRMIVQVLDADTVGVLCDLGDCNFHFGDRANQAKIDAGTRRDFAIAEEKVGDAAALSLADLMAFNEACDLCLADLLPSPSAEPSPTDAATLAMIAQIDPTAVLAVSQPQSPAQPPQVIPPTVQPTPPPPQTNPPAAGGPAQVHPPHPTHPPHGPKKPK